MLAGARRGDLTLTVGYSDLQPKTRMDARIKAAKSYTAQVALFISNGFLEVPLM